MVPESKRNDAAVKAVQAAIDLAEQAKSVGPVDRAGTESRRKPARSSGALRSRDRAQRQAASARRPPTSCSRSSSATANGTTTARASSWCSSSRPGARPTRPPSRAASGCRRSCFVARIQKDTGFRRGASGPGPHRGCDADQCLSRARRPARGHPGVSAARRAAAAARPDAAQHFRAALSRDGRRRAARRPSADRHDPAGHRASRTEDKPRCSQGRLRRPHHPARRIRRRPLHPRTHRRRALQGGRGADGADRLPAMQGDYFSPSSTISPRARARRRSTARRCSRC
jgi:hypothetical protein